MPTKILIADGSPSERASLARLFRHAGFTPAEVSDLPHLMEAVRSGRFDALVVDTALPGLESPGALGTVRESLPSVPILGFSRTPGQNGRTEALRRGVDVYLDHPATPEQMFERVRQALDGDPTASLVDRSLDAIVVTEAEGRILRWSDGAEALFGYRRDEIVGRNLSVLLADEGEKSALPESHLSGLHLATRKHRNGTLLNVELTRTELRDADGNRTATLDVMRDVTSTIMREREDDLIRHFYERVIDTISDGIRVIDAAGGRIVLTNQAHAEWTGMSGGEMIGLTSEEVPWGTDRDGNPVSVRQLVERAVETGSPERAALNASPGSDTRMCWADVGAYPMTNHDGDVEYVVLVGRDISERMQMEAMLAEERDRRDQIFRSAPAGLLTTDNDGTIEFANAHAGEILGVADPKELEGRNMFNLPQVQEMGIEEDIRQMLHTGEPLSLDHAHCTSAHGAELLVNVRARPLYGVDQTSVGLVAVLENVTERVALQRRLRATTSDLAMLAEIGELIHHSRDTDTILQAILVGVTAGEGLGFNRAFLLATDWEDRMLRGKFAIGPADPGEAERIWGELDQKHLTLAEVLRGYQKAIDYKQVRINEIASKLTMSLEEAENIAARAAIEQQAFLVRGETDTMLSQELAGQLGTTRFAVVPLIFNDRVEGIIIADNAITGKEITPDDLRSLELFAHQATLAVERSQLYTDLEESLSDVRLAHRQLQDNHELTIRNERLAAMGQMAAQVAHEIRNPLVSIGGFARSVLKRLDENDPLRRYVSIIVEETTRLETILTEVLQFSRPRAQNRENVDLVELVQGTIHLMDREISARDISLEMDVPDGPAEAFIDPDQIRQVVRNLTINALHAITETSGRDGGDEKTLRVSLAEQSDGYVLTVEDSGPGLDETVLEHLFEPFYTTKSTGTGLGLSICRQIVVDHGGDISAGNNDLGGATFYVKLPRGEEEVDGAHSGG